VREKPIDEEKVVTNESKNGFQFCVYIMRILSSPGLRFKNFQRSNAAA